MTGIQSFGVGISSGIQPSDKKLCLLSESNVVRDVQLEGSSSPLCVVADAEYEVLRARSGTVAVLEKRHDRPLSAPAHVER
jgi:hypothetical protein